MARNVVIINIKKRSKKLYKNYGNESFVDSLLKYIGQTITIFTASGGESGSGFTGVLLSVAADHIKLLTELGSAPHFPIEDNHNEKKDINISLGSITEIPLKKISAFVHNIV